MAAPQPVRVLVCGGRDYIDEAAVFYELEWLHMTCGVAAIIHGAARGADSLAGAWANSRGVAVEKYPALWDVHGRKAGPVRNALMLKDAKPDIVLAFPGGSGTAHMVRISRAAGVPVTVVP